MKVYILRVTGFNDYEQFDFTPIVSDKYADVKKEFDKWTKEERAFAQSCNYEIDTDDEMCFEAQQENARFYNSVCVEIIERELGVLYS